MHVNKGVKLRFAIDFLVIMTICCTVIVNWYSSANALKSALTENYLENNYKYAKKLSLSANDLLKHMQKNINSLANTLGHKEINQEHLNERHSAMGDYFNSLFIVDPDGVIQLISPSEVQFNKKVQAGMKIQSETMKKALSTKKPFVSEPYIATSGQVIMLMSAPIFDKTGKFKGLVAGTIYLESGKNAFHNLLSESRDENGSYVYVVDRLGHLIYHPDSSRIQEDVSEIKFVQQVLQGKSGATRIINSKGIEFFAGYAYEKNTKWGIVYQTPTSIIKDPLHDLLKKMIFQSLPLLLLILIIAWVLANSLSKPLNRLAKFSEDAIQHKKMSVSNLKIKSNIYEVRQLYYHIQNHFQLLNNQIQLDGLTGLANRRTFDLIIKEWVDEKIPFTMIMIDIDHFKKVNDTYGHLVGDDVLKYLSSLINEMTRKGDICFRYGGEEFGILVQDMNMEEVLKIAERLRIKVAETISPSGEPITISLGIAPAQEDDKRPEEIIKRADCALFQSKRNGRNRTTIYDGTCESLRA